MSAANTPASFGCQRSTPQPPSALPTPTPTAGSGLVPAVPVAAVRGGGYGAAASHALAHNMGAMAGGREGRGAAWGHHRQRVAHGTGCGGTTAAHERQQSRLGVEAQAQQGRTSCSERACFWLRVPHVEVCGHPLICVWLCYKHTCYIGITRSRKGMCA